MKLADLIDLEAQLVVDEDADAEALRRRDRAIYGSLPEQQRRDRHRLLSAWLDALRAQQRGSELGAIVSAGHRWLGYLLVIFGLLSGAAVAQALLMYDGQTPVNVGGFLLAVVGVQLGLLVALVVSWGLARVFSDVALVSDVRAALAWLAGKLEPAVERAGRHLSSELRMRWSVARARLRTRSRLYHRVERWVFIELTQLFGIAFNVGVLVLCLRLIYLSDLAFGWSTTADALDSATMYRIVRTLAIPWAWLYPDAVPTFDLVAQSRYSRLLGGFAEGVTGDVVGQWWRFLVACVVTYGLLPRVALWTLARGLRARALARLPLDTPDVVRVIRRLETPRIETRADRAPPPSAAEPAPAPLAPLEPPEPTADGCVVIRWRQAPIDRPRLEDAVSATAGYRVADVADAGATVEADQASQRIAAGGAGPVLVLAEAWEAPDKGIRRYLRDLRAAVGPKRPVYVALIGEGGAGEVVAPTTGEVALWRDRLALLEDPYLGVIAMENR